MFGAFIDSKKKHLASLMASHKNSFSPKDFGGMNGTFLNFGQDY